MAHKPRKTEAPLPTQEQILKAMVAHTMANITEEQVQSLIRIFANFQRNVVREAPATSLPTTSEGLPQ